MARELINRRWSVGFSPSGERPVTASLDGTVRIWKNPEDSHAGDQASYLVLDSALGGVAFAAFSPDGHYVAAVYWEDGAILWRVWSESADTPAALRKAWGEDRSRLSIVRQADRFRHENRLDDRIALPANSE